jgi:cobalt-zinc-cadmium efflux system protein
MPHDHDHVHGFSTEADAGKLTLALGLIAGFMAVEVAVGIFASSLALLSDAAHMLTDAAAIGLSLVAVRLAARPAKGAMTYGLGRAEILSAQINGITLLVLALLIFYEAVRRLVNVPHVDAGPMLATALAGVALNLLVTWVLSQANRRNMGVEGSFQHIVTDLYAFAATAIAAAVILATGFNRADAIASIFVAALMLRAAYGLLKASGRVFLEAAPAGVDPREIGMALAAQPGVAEVHDLHVWEVTSGFPALSAHVLVAGDTDCHAKRRELTQLLHDRFQIEHSTLQVDHEGTGLLTIEDARRRS